MLYIPVLIVYCVTRNDQYNLSMYDGIYYLVRLLRVCSCISWTVTDLKIYYGVFCFVPMYMNLVVRCYFLKIVTDLRKFRTYKGYSVRDLLRAMRNKVSLFNYHSVITSIRSHSIIIS